MRNQCFPRSATCKKEKSMEKDRNLEIEILIWLNNNAKWNVVVGGVVFVVWKHSISLRIED